MKLGIIGSGMIVHEFLSFAPDIENLEIIALCVTPKSEEKGNKLCKMYNISTCYTNVDIMLKDDRINVVYIAVPNHLHYFFAEKSIKANKHVICEKPFTSNVKEMKRLIYLAKEKNVILLEAVSTHYLPNTIHIKEYLEELGNIKIVTANYSQYSSRYDNFKNGIIQPAFDSKMSGGALMDLNIYNINFVVSLFGKPNAVNYEANIENGIDTSGILTLRYDTFKCVCIGAKDCKAPTITTIQGDKGCITICTPVNSIEEYTVLMANTTDQTTYNYNQGRHRMHHEFVAFVEMIDNKQYNKCKQMLEISLITMEVQTKARNTAGIKFASDILV